MAKHRRVWNEAMFRKYIHEGRGQGAYADYIPWILIQDFPSKGMVSRIKSEKTGRIHHLLSNNEMRLFYLLDWSDDVLDIREQYPLLDLRKAIKISEAAQIRYPYDPQSGFPYVMTSDFYIDTVRGPVVIAVKSSSELGKPRVCEKLEIERRYWRNQNIKWNIITENEINPIKARNIEWLSQAKDLGLFAVPKEIQVECKNYFLAHYESNANRIRSLIAEIEVRFALAPGVGINIYKHLAYFKQIDFNVVEEIDFSMFAEHGEKLSA